MKSRLNTNFAVDCSEIQLKTNNPNENHDLNSQSNIPTGLNVNSNETLITECKECETLKSKLKVAEGNVIVLKKTLDELSNSNW